MIKIILCIKKIKALFYKIITVWLTCAAHMLSIKLAVLPSAKLIPF